MEKKLKIGLDIDDKAFVSAVKRMQDQLAKINSAPQLLNQQREISQKMQQMGLGPLPGAPGARDTQQAQQKAKQETDRAFQDSVRKITLAKKLQQDFTAEIQKTNKQLQDGNLSQRDRVALLEKEKSLYEKMSMAKKAETSGIGGASAYIEMEKKRNNAILSRSLGITTGVAAGGAAIAGTVGAGIDALGRLPIESATAAGQAATMLVSNQLKELTTPQGQAFLAERGKGIEMAKKAWQAGRMYDTMGLITKGLLVGSGIAALGLAGAVSGGAIPAAVLGGVSAATAAGAGGTAILGGLGSIISNSKHLSMATGNEAAYEKLSSKDLADLVTQSVKAQEELDPMKKLAAEYNAQNYQRNLNTQRGLGLSDQDYMGKGGFLRRNMAYGGHMQFTEEQVTQQQQAILGAGGSARMGREAGYGLELQKNLNLTNAPQVLANISRTMGGAAETKETTSRVIATAFKDGLNDSDLVDLFRGFTETTSEYISKSGAKTGEDASRIAEQFSKGLVEKTGVGMEAAKSSYEAYQSLSAQQGGPFSIMQRAAMLRSPALNRLSGQGVEGMQLFEALKKTPEQELTENHPAVQASLDLLNKGMKPGQKGFTTAKDILDAKKQATLVSADRTGNLSKYLAVTDRWEQANGMSVEEGMQRGILPDDVRHAANMRGITATATGTGGLAGAGTSAQKVDAAGAQFGAGLGKRKEVYGPGEELKSGQKMADQVEASIAASQDVFIQNFEKFKNVIIPTANDLDSLTQKLVILGQVAADVASGKNTDKGALSKGAASLFKEQPQTSSSPAGNK